MLALKFGDTTVEVYETGTRIVFPDGSVVPGEPEDTDSYRETAEKHGYGADTTALCIEHELMHVALAHWLGVTSPTMDALTGNDPGIPIRQLEEAAVLAIQKYARALGISLVSRFSN